MVSPGGLGASGVALLGVRASLPVALDVSLLGFLPVGSGSASGVEGTARVRPWLLGATLDWTFWTWQGWDMRIGGGVAGTRISMSGEGSTGFRGVNDQVWGVAPLLVAHLGAPLSRALRLELATWVGVTVPEIKVHFGDREAARWGRPLAGGALVLELWP
jgi:hypothetical protein